MDYRITISNEGNKVVQLAFDTENKRRTDSGGRPFDTVDLFLQAQIENEFGLSPDQLEAAAKQAVVDEVLATVRDLKAAELAPVLDAAKAAAEKKGP